MSGAVADRKRLLRITAGNLRNHHIYIRGHYDFFPNELVQVAVDDDSRSIQIFLVGLSESIDTDIAFDPTTGKPRGFFRGRSWVRRFFEHHKIKTGDVLALERLNGRSYRLYPFASKKNRCMNWQSEMIAVPSNAKTRTVLDLFAGCGGFGYGFKQAGFQTSLAVEWDQAACETIRVNITDRVAQCAIEEIVEFPKSDVVVGGPPCQGFSNLGERVPHDPRRQLWRHFLRAVEQCEPKAFVMENVPPLLKSAEYVEIKRIAENLGYSVVGKVLNTADYGVPQTRKRAIVIGLKGRIPSHPEPTNVSPHENNLLTSQLPLWQTVRGAIGDLPFMPDERNWHIGRNPTPKSIERYRTIPLGGNRWNLPSHLMPDCWKRKLKGGTDLFGRLWWDRPSVTIRTEFYKPEKGRYLHPEADRPITHREAARLQSFPDDFDFQGNRIQVGIQIGNAVPPTLAIIIARHVSQLLDSITPAPVR